VYNYNFFSLHIKPSLLMRTNFSYAGGQKTVLFQNVFSQNSNARKSSPYNNRTMKRIYTLRLKGEVTSRRSPNQSNKIMCL